MNNRENKNHIAGVTPVPGICQLLKNIQILENKNLTAKIASELIISPIQTG